MGSVELPEPSCYRLMLGAVFSKQYDTAKVFRGRQDVLQMMYVQRGDFKGKLMQDLHGAISVSKDCKGVILDAMSWPHYSVLEAFRRQDGRDSTLALYVGEKMLEHYEYSSSKIARVLGQYEGVIDYAFIRPKVCADGEHNQTWLEQCVERVFHDNEWLGVAVAGVVGPNRVENLRPLLSKCPEVGLIFGSTINRQGDALDPREVVKIYSEIPRLYCQHGKAA
jgi:hypothetical protein